MFKVISLPNVVCLGDLITVTALLFVGTNFRDFYKSGFIYKVGALTCEDIGRNHYSIKVW
jgi:hypothetical protein